MQINIWRAAVCLSIALVPLSSARALRSFQNRNVLSDLQSFGDSVLGITLTGSTSAPSFAAVSPAASNPIPLTTEPIPTSTSQIAATNPAPSPTRSSSPTRSQSLTGSRGILTSLETPFDATIGTPSPSSTSLGSALITSTSISNQLTSASAIGHSSSTIIPNLLHNPHSSSPQNTTGSGSQISPAGKALVVTFSLITLAFIPFLGYRLWRSMKERQRQKEEKMLFFAPADHGGGGEHGERDKGYLMSDVSPVAGKLGHELDKRPQTADSQRSFQSRSRAASESTLVADPARPVSPLDKMQSYPFRGLPSAHTSEQRPIVSLVREPRCRSFSVPRTVPRTVPQPPQQPQQTFRPYIPSVEYGIGIAVPLGVRPRVQEVFAGSSPRMGDGIKRKPLPFAKVRRISGTYELS